VVNDNFILIYLKELRMSWNKDAAVSYLRSHALGRSHSECASLPALAILAGGVKVANTDYAKDYGANYYVLDSVSCRPVQR
jgi:hypothetical protein